MKFGPAASNAHLATRDLTSAYSARGGVAGDKHVADDTTLLRAQFDDGHPRYRRRPIRLSEFDSLRRMTIPPARKTLQRPSRAANTNCLTRLGETGFRR